MRRRRQFFLIVGDKRTASVAGGHPEDLAPPSEPSRQLVTADAHGRTIRKIKNTRRKGGGLLRRKSKSFLMPRAIREAITASPDITLAGTQKEVEKQARARLDGAALAV